MSGCQLHPFPPGPSFSDMAVVVISIHPHGRVARGNVPWSWGKVIQKMWAESIHVSIKHPMKSIHERDFDSKVWGASSESRWFWNIFLFSPLIWGRCTHIFSQGVENTRRASLKILSQFLCPAKAPVVIYCLTSVLTNKTTMCYLFCLAALTCGKMDG